LNILGFFCKSLNLFLYRSATVAGELGLFSGVQLRHAALERNKRCILAYL